MSTEINLSTILERLSNQRQNPTKRKHTLLLDMKKAYDSISRAVIKIALDQRVMSEDDKTITELILKITQQSYVISGEERFDTGRGVPQGGVLSPFLFNIALDHVLIQSDLIKQVIRRGDLIAFADDLLIQSASLNEIKAILAAFERFGEISGLSLNRSKCQLILAAGTDVEVTPNTLYDIPIVSQAKYLGVIISANPAINSRSAKLAVKRNLASLKARLYRCSIEVKEQVLLSYCRSLLLYFAVPLICGGVWSEKDVESLEK